MIKREVSKMNKKLGALLVGGLLLAGTTVMAEERDPIPPRVPADQIAAAKAMKNPIPKTPENIKKGKEMFMGKGTCFNCHGDEGKGDGPAGVVLDPSPRNFTNKAFFKARTEGEMFWVITHGSPGTGMVPLAGVPGAVITEQEAWTILLFERSLGE